MSEHVIQLHYDSDAPTLLARMRGMTEQLTETSKYLSYILRHEPQSIGLELDSEGWVDIDTLISAAGKAGTALDRELIQHVVDTSEKKRFTVSADGRRIRAAQGHTTAAVDIQHVAKTPPDVLYHGTATRFLESILAEGLRPGQRHHVHLSENVTTATEVGKRYGTPVILQVDAARLHQQGVVFFQADNGVWLVEQVPAEFLAPVNN